jgi:hypothetical protein
MKGIIRNSVLALALLGLSAAPHAASAQTGGLSAFGSIKLASEEGPTKRLEFEASTDGEGKATGRMVFSGPEEIPGQDVDGAGDKVFSGKIEDLYVEASFDGMTVEGNRAVMSGFVTACTVGEYIGQRVLLVVEDNGDGGSEKTQDKVTWGFYRPAKIGWTPTDAELDNDDGALLKWVATDFERDDDKGIQMPEQNEEISHQSFPLSAHDFVEVKYTDGDIQVRH